MGTYKRDAPTPTAELPTQTRRLGKYELIAEIGMGGMAAVYLARLVGPMNFEKVVVVKTIHRHLAREEEFINMLLDEARISALIKHPNVVDIYDLGVANDTYFIAMEYLAGQPLSQLLKQGKKGNQLDPYIGATVIQQAAAGLHAAHDLTTMAGEHLELIHRDVSPGNIMVLYDGTVKLLDFGVSKARGRITASDTGQLKGKIGYVAPEQVAGDKAIDARVDVYSLGVVMWEMLAYRRLFYNDSQAATLKQITDGVVPPPSRFRPDVPTELESICLKAMARRPEDRFQTADELRRAVVDVLRTAEYDVHAMPAYMKETFAAQRGARASLLRDVAGAEVAHVQSDLQELEIDPPDYVPEGTPVSRRKESAARLRQLANAGRLSLGPSDDSERTPVLPVAPALSAAPEPMEPKSSTALTVSPAPMDHWRIAMWMGVGVALGATVVALILGSGADRGDQAIGPAPAPDAPGLVVPAPTAEPAVPAAALQVEPVAAPGDASDIDAAPADAAPSPSSPDAEEAQANPSPSRDSRPREARRGKRARAEAERLYKEGLKMYIAGNASGARTKFRRSLDADSRYAPAFRGLGLAYERLGRKDKAVQWLRRYLRANPRAKDAAAIEARIRKLGG